MFKYLIAALLAAPSILAQAKVGTTGAQFLELPPSVRAVGMGDAGITLTSDRAYYYNPGSLGLLDCPRIQIAGSPFPTEYPAGVDYYSMSIAGKLKKATTGSPLSLAFAYHLVWLNSGELVEQTYDGTGNTFSYKDYAHKVTASLAHVGGVEYGFGVTVAYACKKENDRVIADGVTYDYGMLVRVPLGRVFAPGDSGTILNRCRIDVGFAVDNLGSALTYFDHRYTLPVERRSGIGVNIVFQPFTLYPVLQLVHHTNSLTRTHLGFEVEWKKAISARTGLIKDDNDRTTMGLTVKSGGLYEALTGREWRLPLDLNISYAWVEGVMTGTPGMDFYGIELNL